ncbi:C-22 sterol desaturase [Saccharomycopsis crataegensis]|uniref:C-22 sterol desaturase ERG5 n=1 Tax=Saccharomycopsis crataegensis TaxID=43959 RepID=A0AAV5QTV5_9ASCO|nr:C-22 sterol desaturase [Saccharomycopsis crataegensis]
MEVLTASFANTTASLPFNQYLSDFDFSQVSWLKVILTTLCLAMVYDQVSYQLSKGNIAGPTFKFYPFIGPFLESLDPKFEIYQAKWNSGPLSCVSIFHKFVVIASTRDLARKVLSSPKYVKPCVVDVAVKILRPSNWVFLDGKAHVDYRKSLNGLFTRQALEMYIPQQEKIYDKYLSKFVELSKDGPIPFFHDFREIMCAVSLKTFCGDYITDDQIRKIADDYYLITAALELVNFPIIIPYTKTWYGKKTADMVMKIFEGCAGKAKEHIKNGGEAICVMDAWVELMEEARKNKSDNPESKLLVREFSNKEISEAIFTFLFASQDASSAATCWLYQIVADRPDVVRKIHEEQLAVRGGDPNVPLSLDLIEKMTYTNMVVKETLRYRPPVIMVPYVAKQKVPLTESYSAPKGSMVIPTLYPALHDPEAYENPEEFIPERWVAGGAAEQAKKNWLVFGTGPHVCLGQQYVMLLFTGLIGKSVMFNHIKHKVTPLSEKIKVFATIFPQDDCILEFSKRDDPTVLDAVVAH